VLKGETGSMASGGKKGEPEIGLVVLVMEVAASQM
jgi:hypothetical protein